MILCVFMKIIPLFCILLTTAMKKKQRLGLNFLETKKRVEEYTKLVNNVLEKQRALHKQNHDLMEIIQVSREFNKIYTMTEAVRLKNFEHAEDEKTWNKFKKIAELRFRSEKEIGRAS